MNDDSIPSKDDFFLQGLLTSGLEAYYAGRDRTDYPYGKDMRRPDLIYIWQLGWDIGMTQTALEEEAVAAFFFGDSLCPYDHPMMVAAWERGCRIARTLETLGRRGGLRPSPHEL